MKIPLAFFSLLPNIWLELPPSTSLYSELSAPEYTLSARGIQVQSKEDLIRKLGRSPDLADAVVLACSTG
jgi:hypothetical protein